MNSKMFHISNISLGCMARYLLRNLWMLVATALIFAMSVSMYFSWFHAPVYQGTMTYAVTSRKTTYASGGNVASAREVASVMSEMLQTGMVLNTVRNSSEDLKNFRGSIQASLLGNSNFVVITVTDSSPETTVKTLRALQDLLPTVTGYLSSGNIVQLVRNPAISAAPVNQVNVARYCRIAALAGAAAMAALLCWMEIQRQTIQTRSAARHLIDAPVIASICREGERFSPKGLLKKLLKKEKKPLQVFAPTISFAYTEQINGICAQIEHEAEQGSRVFLIAGAGENEGKSTVSGNVAAALSMRGKRVALVDCDLRNPSLREFFDNKYSALLPLNEMLAQPFSRDNLVQCMQLHEKLGIFMLFPIKPDKRCAELLAGDTMDLLLRQLRVFDIVLLDTPPMNLFADAEALAEKSDASILVVRQDRTSAFDINRACEILRASASKFMGVVLNDMTSSMTEGYGYGRAYGYGKYGYGKYGYGKHKKGHGYGYGYGYDYGYGYGYGYGEEHSHHKSGHSRKGG